MKNDYITLLGKNAELVPKVLERFLYGCVAYSVEAVKAVEEICGQNPNATVMVLGLYNPLRGLKFTAFNKTLEVDVLFDKMIDFCNVYLLDKTLEMEKVAFVDISEVSIPGFESIEINFEKDPSTYLGEIQAAYANQYADNDGHNYIFEKLRDSLCTHTDQEWVQVEAPKCSKEGKEECVCNICGEEVTRPIAKLPHSFGDYKTANDATCQKAGTLTASCAVCGEIDTVADPSGVGKHEFGDEGLCIYCNSPIETSDSNNFIVFILIGAVVVAGGAVGCLWIYKKKKGRKQRNRGYCKRYPGKNKR